MEYLRKLKLVGTTALALLGSSAFAQMITLNSLDLINKMQGYYEKEGESGQIDKVLQAFQVNVTVENKIEK